MPGSNPPGYLREFSVLSHANTLGRVLAGEFSVPFALYDCDTGERLSEVSCPEFPDAPSPPLMLPTEVKTFAHIGLNGVVLLQPGRYLLQMLIHQGSKPVLVAAATYIGLARTAPEADREIHALEKWLNSVASRLRLSDQMNARSRAEQLAINMQPPWETLVNLEEVIHRMKIHKDPEKNRQRVWDAAFKQISAEALVWVPSSPHEPLMIQGHTTLSHDELRHLALAIGKIPELKQTGILLLNQLDAFGWSARHPSIVNLLVLTAQDQRLHGWVFAINKVNRKESNASRVAFRRSDAVLLLPFVSLLKLHSSAATRYQELKELLVGLTRSLTSALDAKDNYTFGHSERVARSAVEIGKALALDSDVLSDIYLAGLLHDVGKIGVRDEVLLKPGQLTAEEFEEVKKHVRIGFNILQDLKPIRNLLPGVLYHHESWDGSGYPDGLAGEQIPFMARILAVADAFDALTTSRPYRAALPLLEVERILLEGAGKQWDKSIIDAFFRVKDRILAERDRQGGESLRLALEDALRSQASFRLPHT